MFATGVFAAEEIATEVFAGGAPRPLAARLVPSWVLLVLVPLKVPTLSAWVAPVIPSRAVPRLDLIWLAAH